jgi:lipoyl(octanoyl) transferase
MLEHPAVYTLGQGSDLRFVKFSLNDPQIEWHRTERGGEVTYHAVGQLVVYPIFNLRHYQPDLHWYLRRLEEVVILTLETYGLKGDRKPGLTGVWLGDKKVAQIGIKVTRWITMHGFAINVAMDMAGFAKIVPCGISHYGCTQLRDFLPHITVKQVQGNCLTALAEVFDLVFTQGSEPMN